MHQTTREHRVTMNEIRDRHFREPVSVSEHAKKCFERPPYYGTVSCPQKQKSYEKSGGIKDDNSGTCK